VQPSDESRQRCHAVLPDLDAVVMLLRQNRTLASI
jgi:hypothetical protein